MTIRENRTQQLRTGIQRNISNNSIDLYIIREEPMRSGRPAMIATEFILETIQEGEMYNPLVNFTPEEAAHLMDELWNAGVRPSNGAGSNATLDAKDAHLEDLRRLVFESKSAGRGE